MTQERVCDLMRNMKKPLQGVAFYFWWAHQDLNLGPKDSGLCSFHYSLDYAFIISIARLRWVPSSLYTFKVFLLSFARR